MGRTALFYAAEWLVQAAHALEFKRVIAMELEAAIKTRHSVVLILEGAVGVDDAELVLFAEFTGATEDAEIGALVAQRVTVWDAPAGRLIIGEEHAQFVWPTF